ncbi:iron chelate uptake ABC transporter family permease subunit [Corynebacterium striatum]|uniref:iron chelate uptake ABC transporter family permease subunit n=1 Tax=Corynebacterium striatum TaxID=43770 RepID=UPI001F0A334C|nr:iron chelate uptake ABC transporter family permease subunit [Corynebacterium striatum]
MRPSHARLIPVTLISGALFMISVGTTSRVVFQPTPLPVGVGTAIIGMPLFIWLLARRKALS